MQWPPEDSYCYAWLPEPETAAERTEGRTEGDFLRYDKHTPLISNPLGCLYVWGGRLIFGGSG